MKAYVIRPTFDVFDGTGTLNSDASETLEVIAEMVADALQTGGDNSHRATVWDPPQAFVEVGTAPSVIAASDRATLVSLVRRMLDPNDFFGGDIRSAVNCRAATFGQDGQALLCLMHEDAAPTPANGAQITVTEHSDWLAQTDLFDGGWPQS